MKVSVHNIFLNEGNKAADKIAASAVKNKFMLKQVLEGADSDNKRVKNASAKCLREISRINPKVLYPHFNFFVKLIEGDENILKWNAIDVLGNLTDVDTGKKFNTNILKKYFGLLRDKSMVTAANTFRILGKVALNKPKFRKKITAELMNVEELPFSVECKNILAGTAIEAFEMFIDEVDGKEEIIKFAKKHILNRRSGTRKKGKEVFKEFRNSGEVKYLSY